MYFKESIREFKSGEFEQHKDLFESLSNEQHPHTLFITCSDSRVQPNMITQTKPGELFMVRNIGNIVPKYHEKIGEYSTISAIEYAVLVLGVENIIVCGHSNCGACAAIWKENIQGKHVRMWLQQLDAVKRTVKICGFSDKPESERSVMTERLGVKLQLKRLLRYPYVKERVEDGTLNIEGWWYDIKKGNIYIYDLKKDRFKKV